MGKLTDSDRRAIVRHCEAKWTEQNPMPEKQSFEEALQALRERVFFAVYDEHVRPYIELINKLPDYMRPSTTTDYYVRVGPESWSIHPPYGFAGTLYRLPRPVAVSLPQELYEDVENLRRTRREREEALLAYNRQRNEALEHIRYFLNQLGTHRQLHYFFPGLYTQLFTYARPTTPRRNYSPDVHLPREAKTGMRNMAKCLQLPVLPEFAEQAAEYNLAA